MSFRDRMAAKTTDALGESKSFIQDLQPGLREYETTTGRFGREYVLDGGISYPSVTTVLGATADKSWLDEWKERTDSFWGEGTAEKITNQSGRRGTALHQLCQDYLSNDPDYLAKTVSPIYIDFFGQVKKRLDENVDIVHGIECVLFSHALKVAGRTDTVAPYKNKNSIIDYKNARYFKKVEDVVDYYIQITMYADMWNDMFPINPIEQGVILMAVEGNTGKPALEFIFDPNHYMITMRDRVAKFYEMANQNG